MSAPPLERVITVAKQSGGVSDKGKDLRISAGIYDNVGNEEVKVAEEDDKLQPYEWKITMEDTRDWLKMMINGLKAQAVVAILVMVDVSMMFSNNPFASDSPPVPTWQHDLTWFILIVFTAEVSPERKGLRSFVSCAPERFFQCAEPRIPRQVGLRIFVYQDTFFCQPLEVFDAVSGCELGHECEQQWAQCRSCGDSAQRGLILCYSRFCRLSWWCHYFATR